MRANEQQVRQFLEDAALVVRYTRRWLHYGVIAFTALCTVIAALRGLAAGL